MDLDREVRPRPGGLSDRRGAAGDARCPARGRVPELVADRAAYGAVVAVETAGWGRAPLDPAFVERGYVEYVRGVENREGFAILATIDGVPAAAGRCRMYGEVARLAGAVTLPEARRRGACRRVLAARLALAETWGAALALARARPSTSAPILEHGGFERYRVERCYSVRLSHQQPASRPSRTSDGST